MNTNKMLLLYSGILTLAVGGQAVSSAIAGPPQKAQVFDTIEVKRINIREDDGTIRMIVSNTSRAPGIIFHGKETPHPSGNRGAGMIFYNNEGTENGGLIFGGGVGPDGKVRSGGHLSFDQHEQDQVIQLTQNEHDGKRWAAMVVNDRPDHPIDLDFVGRLSKMPDGEEKAAILKKAKDEGTFGQQRVYVGKTRDRDSAVTLSDAKGRPRIMMKVAADGTAAIDFLDEKGAVVRTIAPDTK